MVVCRLKNRASYRTVPLAGVVVDALAAHVKEFPPVEVEVEDESNPAKPVRRKALFLFSNGRGRPINRDAFNPQIWRPSCRRAATALHERAARQLDVEVAADLRRRRRRIDAVRDG